MWEDREGDNWHITPLHAVDYHVGKDGYDALCHGIFAMDACEYFLLGSMPFA